MKETYKEKHDISKEVSDNKIREQNKEEISKKKRVIWILKSLTTNSINIIRKKSLKKRVIKKIKSVIKKHHRQKKPLIPGTTS